MALVSEGLGIKEANTASVFLRQLAILLAQAIKDGKKRGYTDEHMKGAKSILKHIKNGGQVAYQGVDKEDAALFEKLLKNKRVAFVKVAEIDGKVYYTTKDKDKQKVAHVFEMMADELKVGFKELTPQEFLADNEGREVGHAKGYTEAELEIFRKEAANLGFSYAIVGNENKKGLYDILYSKRDDAVVKKALKGMAYEMSGPEGMEYQADIARALNLKASILATSKTDKNAKQYILNVNNPMQFITIQGNVMVQHNLTVEEKAGKDGQPRMVMKDSVRKTSPFGNRELTLAMKACGKCALVPEEKMKLFKNFDNSKAVIVTDAKEALETLKQIQKEFKLGVYPVYEANIGRKGSVQFDKICTLTDIEPKDMMQIVSEMEKAGLSYMSVSGDFLYKEQEKKEVEDILNRTLYREEDSLERFWSKIYYEGRGPKGLNLLDSNQPYYIVSAKDTDIVLKVTDHNFEIIKNGAVVASVDAKQEGFETQLSTLLDKMEDVAILTEEEMNQDASAKVSLIEERVSTKENEASKQYYKDYNERKEQFINTKIEDMSPEDKEIVRSYTDHEIVATYVERSFSEKIIDMDLGAKLREETVETTRTERGSEPDR